jgi:hypothetical protein
MREGALLARYQLRLLDWWPFLLMLLAYVACGLLAWVQVQSIGGDEGMRSAAELSRFVMEPVAGLFAGVLAGSAVVSDPLLEVTMATAGGIYRVAAWRLLLAFCALAACSAAYLAWSLVLGVSYSGRQSPIYLLVMWLAPALVMGMLGLFGSLLARNAALGVVLASIPLVGSLFAYGPLSAVEAAHPFFITYTFSGGQDAPDWWANRLTLLGIAVLLAVFNGQLLSREERLLGSFR